MPTHIRALTPTDEGKIIASNKEIKKRLLSLFWYITEWKYLLHQKYIEYFMITTVGNVLIFYILDHISYKP